jgi:hypothetical protein
MQSVYFYIFKWPFQCPESNWNINTDMKIGIMTKLVWTKLSLYHYIFCQMSVWVDFKRKSKKSSFLIYMNNEAMLRGERNKFL